MSADLIGVFTTPLNSAGIRYAVTGSVAGTFYGEPRFTNDVDIVIDLAAAAVARFLALWPAENFYAPPEEVVEVEVRRAPRRRVGAGEEGGGGAGMSGAIHCGPSA